MSTLSLFQASRARVLGADAPAVGGGSTSGSTSVVSSLEQRRKEVYSKPFTATPITAPQSVYAPISKPSFIDTAKNVVSNISDFAKRLVPQLGIAKPTQQIEAPTFDNKIKLPKNLVVSPDRYDFGGNQELSAQLTPEAKAISKTTKLTKTLEVGTNYLDNVALSLKEEGKSRQRDLNQLANEGFMQQAYAPSEEMTLENKPVKTRSDINQLVSDFEKDQNLGQRLNKAYGLVVAGNIEGVTAGIVKAKNVQPNDALGKISYGIGKVLGSTYTLSKIGTAFDGIANGSTTIGQFIEKYPKIAKVVIPWAKNVLGFDLYGQLDPDTKDRMQKLAMDTVTGTIFAAVSGVKSGLVSIPANFALGYGLAKHAGASDEDAFINGGIMASLDLVQRGGKFAFDSQLKTKSGTVRMTPDEAMAQVQNTNLKGTPAGETLQKAAMQAKVQNKDLEIFAAAYKKSTGLEDLFKIKTPGGTQLGINLVEPSMAPTVQLPGQTVAEPAQAPSVGAIIPTAESTGFAAKVSQGAPVAPITPVVPEMNIADANKTTNRSIAIKTANETMLGNRESERLDTEKTIYKTGKGLGIENPTPDSEVTLYRGGTDSIKPGDYVTTNMLNAQQYVESRGGDTQLFTKKATVKDLVRSNGPTIEFIYAPKATLQSAPKETQAEVAKTELVQPEMKRLAKEAAQHVSAEDFATIQGTVPESQIGLMDPKDIMIRDTVDMNTADFKALEENIQAKGIKDPVIVTAKNDGTVETTDGSHRVSVALKLGMKVPVIVTQGEIPGLPTIAEFYKEVATKKTKAVFTKKVDAVKELQKYYVNADPETYGQALFEVLGELEIAEAGTRTFNKTEGQGSTMDVVGTKSTFPDWVPEELRSRKLFDSILGGLYDPSKLVYPPNSQPRKQALYDTVLGEIDMRAGLDSSDLVAKVKEQYEQEKIAKADSRSTARSKTKKGKEKLSASGNASVGEFIEEPAVKRDTVNTINIIEFPEMVKLVKEITGNLPKLANFRNPYKRGEFNPIGQTIRLSRELFANEAQAARTLAHEIGHLVDFIAATGNTMSRGNLLGRLASLQSYRKWMISDKPPHDENLITADDKKRLMKEARELAKQPSEVTEEVEVGTSKITPKEILDIWRDTTVGIKNPELVKYIQTLNNRQKAEIARAAMNNQVVPWVNFMKSIKQTITRKVIKNAPADIKRIFKEKLEEEIKKRNLVQLQVIKKELKDLSFAWRPFDQLAADSKFIAYRNSGKELYADAISVLFNDPVRLQQQAPVFYRTFFNYLENKPKASEAFFDAWHLLNKGEDAVLKDRIERIDQMFKNDEDKFTALQLERGKVKRDVAFELKYEFIDKNQKVLDKIAEARKAGKIVPDDENPKYMLDGYNYVAGKIKAFLEREINPWYSKLADQGVTWEQVGKFMMLERIISERSEIANPLGFTKGTAKPTLEKMKAELGEAKVKAITEAIVQYRKASRIVLEKAYKEGQLYTEDLYNQMEKNPAYAAFRVTDYLDKSVSAKVYKQVGTLKDIGNPATATLGKLVATIRATERAKTNRGVIEFLKKNHPDDIELAKTRWNGKKQVAIEPDDGRGLVYNYEQGKAVGYYVDPYIADAVDFSGIQNMNIVLKGLQFANSKQFRPLFVGINLGFQISNFRKDFIRLWKNSPDISPAKVIANYIRAIPAAKRRALGEYDKLINSMEESGMLSVTYNDVLQGRTDDDKQIDDIFAKYLGRSEAGTNNPLLKVASAILKVIEVSGNFIETLPKVAGYYQMENRVSPQQLADFVRTKAGSPDFLRRGNSYQAMNNLFLFSNARKEGMRSDFNTFTEPKTAGGYWFKTFLNDFMPKILMFAAAAGAFGAYVKRMVDNISEYTKTNYNPIPLGIDENGKTVYLMAGGPLFAGTDETGALFGGLFWKALTITKNKDLEKGISDILAYAGGSLIPGMNPAINSLEATSQYLQGQNPYDSFRNRNVIPDEKFKAGGLYKLMPFLSWQFQSLGGSIIMGGSVVENTGNATLLEKTLNIPVASNILSRFIRVSDYGQSEINRSISDQLDKEKAIQNIKDDGKIEKAIERVRAGENKKTVEKDLINQVISENRKNPEINTKITNIRNNFGLALIKGQRDPNINSLIYASGNREKALILRRLESDMDKKTFEEFRKEAIKNKIISPEVVGLSKNL